MTRTRVRHCCEACGAEAPKWLGRCPDCGTWGSLVEAVAPTARAATPSVVPGAAVPLASVGTDPGARRPSGVGELDRVLAGGFVPGSVTLLGGEPGIGKSTLLLQSLAAMAAAGARCLLVSAEESPEQVRLRAERLGPLPGELLVLAETSLPYVLAHAETIAPDVLAVDSIQMVADPDSPGVPGSVSQVRDCAQRLVRYAKERDVATVLVGHVTKEGTLAGPRVLEHVVDTVLSFDGDRHHALRFLRARKHRFGPTDELGLLEMRADGLASVPDASAIFLADRREGSAGSVVAPVLEGTRPLLVEVQALVAASSAAMPRRAAQALDASRLAMLLAVLARRAGVDLGMHDVYSSVAGGVRVQETGVDLALVLALVSAHLDRPVADDTVVLGEVGLGGEVRQVPHTARRLAEAARLGFRRAIVPTSTADVSGLTLTRVPDVTTALTPLGPLAQ
ncbi:MAG TPA: DNA repair protein RadA [Acidimicrobiia bacterium]|nr:DNA repair protein RadA [Acidimicrobiia bacterium]